MAYSVSLLAVKPHGKPRLASVKIERKFKKLVNVTKCLVWGVFIGNNLLMALDPDIFEIFLQKFSLHLAEIGTATL